MKTRIETPYKNYRSLGNILIHLPKLTSGYAGAVCLFVGPIG